MNRSLATTALIAAAMSMTACQSKAPETLPPQPASATPAQSGGQASGPQPGTLAHFKSVLGGRDVIYFDTDRFNIDSQDAAALQAQAQWLMQYAGTRATIEGHCDERGTRDYNLALGERRANAAKNYLVSLGVPAERISTISYGKERPVALGSNEGSWARNRRAVTITVN